MHCPRCQHENRPQAKFCEECTGPLKEASPTTRSHADDLKAEVESLRQALTEAYEQQTATAEILRVISSSPTDVQPVFAAVLTSAARLCDASDATIFQVEGDRLRIAAHEGPIGVTPVGAIPLIRGTAAGRAVLDRRTIHVADLQAEMAEYPESSVLARSDGFRTVLNVPLLCGAEVIGAVSIRRTDVRPFTDRQIELLQTFAAQAVIAIENVRLFNETKEALEQQTATSEILRVIARSPTDLQPVLDAMAENAARLCTAYDASILRLDGNVLRSAAHHGPIPTNPLPVPVIRGTVNGRAVLDRQAVQVADLQAEVEEFPEGSMFARDLGHRTLLSVPLLREGKAIGTIGVRRIEVQPFTDTQVALLRTFADQAVIAIENVRLFTELQEKNRALTEAHAQVTESLEQQTATAEILRVIASSPTDIQPVFDAIVASAVRLCEARYGAVFSFDGELVRHVAHHNVSEAWLDTTEYPMRPTRTRISGRAILSGSVVQIADVALDADYGGPAARSGFRSLLAVPIVRGGAPIGAIVIYRREAGPFPDKHIELLKTFAAQAVIAIENVRLFTELQTSNRELTTALDTQTATSEILRVISRSQTDVQPVFDAIVNSAVRLLAGYAGVMTRVAGDQIVLVAHTSTDDVGDATLRATFPRPLDAVGTSPQAIRGRAPVNITDAQTDPQLSEAGHAIARARGYHSMVAVPMLQHDEALGAIAVTRQEPGGFTDDEIALLKTFAAQAVIAIENVRLFN